MDGITLPNTIPQGLPLGATPAPGATLSLGRPASSSGQPGFQPSSPFQPPAPGTPSNNVAPGSGPFQSSFDKLSQISQVGSPSQDAQGGDQAGSGNNVAQDVGLGIAKGGIETAGNLDSILGNTVGRLVNAVTGRGFTPISPASGQEVKVDNQAHNTAQAIGKGAEQVLELFTMPEVGAGDAAVRLGADTATFGGKAAVLGAKGAAEGAQNLALGQLHGSQTPGTDFAFGAASPLVGKGVSQLWEAAPKIVGKVFSLPETLQTILKQPGGELLFKQGLKDVAENPQAPYLKIANEVASGMIDGEKSVKQAYQTGLDSVKAATAGKTFDVSPQIDELNKVLKDNNIKVSLVRGENGSMTEQLAIVKTPQLQLSDSEVSNINDLLNSARQSTKVSFDDLRQLQQKFDNAYNAVPLSVNHTATTYHNIVSKLSSVIDNRVASVTEEFQPVMKHINAQYKEYKQVFRQFGNKFVDRSTGAPQLAPGAESFLSGLLNKNKGVLQGNVAKKLEEFTGIPVLDRTAGVKAAVDMSTLASSGKLSKVQKILQSTGAAIGTGLGYMKGGIGGAFEGGFAGRKGGELLGSVGSPKMGLRVLGAAKKLSSLSPTTTKTLGAVAKVGQRTFTNRNTSP
jgi:hypothetical protein